MSALEVLGVACERGASAHGACRVGELRDGSPLDLLVRLVRGGEPGPTLTLTAMAHGDEPNGMVALNRVCDEAAAAGLRGTIVAFPAADPLAVISRAARSDLDRTGDGAIAGRLAGLLAEGMRGADAHVDLRDGGFDFVARQLVVPDEAGLALARAFGMGVPVAVGGPGAPAAAARPALVVRLGGAGRVWPRLVDEAVAGTLNVLRHLGMLAGGPAGTATAQPVGRPAQPIGNGGEWPRAGRGGWWEQHARLGDAVAAGARIGRVRDAFGDVLEEIDAPFGAVVAEVRNGAAIMTGERTGVCVAAALTRGSPARS